MARRPRAGARLRCRLARHGKCPIGVLLVRDDALCLYDDFFPDGRLSAELTYKRRPSCPSVLNRISNIAVIHQSLALGADGLGGVVSGKDVVLLYVIVLLLLRSKPERLRSLLRTLHRSIGHLAVI